MVIFDVLCFTWAIGKMIGLAVSISTGGKK